MQHGLPEVKSSVNVNVLATDALGAMAGDGLSVISQRIGQQSLAVRERCPRFPKPRRRPT
jgi:hypothetical protein